MDTQRFERIYSKHGITRLGLACDITNGILDLLEDGNACQDSCVKEMMQVVLKYKGKQKNELRSSN